MANVIISEEEYNELKKSRDNWRDCYYEIRYALCKDEQLDESISCVRDIPSDVEVVEDLKKRAADSDYYKEKSELLEERNDNQFNIIREKDKKIEDLKIYADENKSMYADLKYWKERCHNAERDVTILNSKVETLKNKKDKYLKKIVDQQAIHYKQCARILDLENMVNKLQSGEYDNILAKDIEIKSLQDKYEAAMTGWKDAIDTNDKWQSEIDKKCKEECEKKYRDEISKLQNIVTEKDVEIKGLRKDNVRLNKDISWGNMIAEKNTELNQTISDQEVTIKALLITIKEMCKEEM